MVLENKKISELVVGDKIIGSDGQPITVTEAYDEHIPERMYELEMVDGEVVKASGNHLWYCETETDNKEKKAFKRSARKYFKRNILPAFDPYCPAYPLEIIGEKFASTQADIEFIKRVALSLGSTVSTPSLTFDNYMDLVDDYLLFTYSYNNLIDFLVDMKNSLIKKSTENKYFYFGKVRTTDEIYSIMDKGEKISIPHKGDITRSN